MTSYTRNSGHIISTLETTPFPQNCILATIDVSSLYLNIPLFWVPSFFGRQGSSPIAMQTLFDIVSQVQCFLFPYTYIPTNTGNGNGHQDGPLLREHLRGLSGETVPWEWASSTGPLEALHRWHPLCLTRFEGAPRGFPAQTQFLPPNHTLYMHHLHGECWVLRHKDLKGSSMFKSILNPLTPSSIFTSPLLTLRECLRAWWRMRPFSSSGPTQARMTMRKQSQLLGTTYSVEGTLKVLLTHSSPQFHTLLETTTSNLFLPLTSTSPLALISYLTPSPPDSSLLTPPHLLTSIKL